MNLGTLVSQVEARIAAYNQAFEDPIMRMSGCADEFAPSMYRKLKADVLELVQAAGFVTWWHFIDAVTRQTSERWVYFNTSLSMMFDEPENTNY